MTTQLILAFWQTVQGKPLPYSVGRDSTVTMLLLCCLFVTLLVLARCRRLLLQEVKLFFARREDSRSSFFEISTTSEANLLLLLVIQTCVLASVYIYVLSYAFTPAQMLTHRSALWIGLYFLCVVGFLLLKWLVYALVGWVFVDKKKRSALRRSYLLVLYMLGLALLPATWVAAYYGLTPSTELLVGILIVLAVESLILFKWIKLFCKNLYGCLPIFMYFCALEIIPLFYMVVGIMKLNGLVVFNF